MPTFTFTQPLRQLEKRKGGYYYLSLDADTVNQYEKKKAVRLRCNIDDTIEYSCGLNHMGDGSFFIIVATKILRQLDKELGDQVTFRIFEDPNPLGVEVPEVLEVFLDQDEVAAAIYDQLTDGKKRSLIYTIRPTKNIDKQIEKIQAFLTKEAAKLKK